MSRLFGCLIPAVIFIFTLFICFSPTSVAALPPTAGGVDKPVELNWVDAETGAVLFTLSDIVRFDWDRQIFELTPDRATQFMAVPVVQHKDFAVKDHDGVIYRGRFYRSAATEGEGYDGTTILIDQGPLKKLPASPFFTINGGYPAGGGVHDRDRFSDRMYAILAKAGLLAPITDAEMPIQRLWSGHIWVGGDQVIKAAAVLFPETFRIGKDAYIHLLLYKGQKPDFAFDKLTVFATCTANEGKFTSRQEIISITPPLLDNGIYICKFRPWETRVIPSAQDNAFTPVVVSSTPPRYPKDAMNENREGKVTASVTVEGDAKVSDISIISSSGSQDFDRSVLRALQKYSFSPVTFGGRPDKGVMKFQFTFAKGKVTQAILPPDPVKVIAKPGQVDLAFEIIALRQEGKTLVNVGAWTLPTKRKIELLPEAVPPIPAPAPVPPPAK